MKLKSKYLKYHFLSLLFISISVVELIGGIILTFSILPNNVVWGLITFGLVDLAFAVLCLIGIKFNRKWRGTCPACDAKTTGCEYSYEEKKRTIASNGTRVVVVVHYSYVPKVQPHKII